MTAPEQPVTGALTEDEREALTTAAIAVNGHFPDDLFAAVEHILAARSQPPSVTSNETDLSRSNDDGLHDTAERAGGEAVERAASVFGWQHLVRFSGQTQEWMDRTLIAIVAAALSTGTAADPACTCGAIEVSAVAQHLRPCPLAPARDEAVVKAETLDTLLRVVDECTGHEPGYWMPRLALTAIEALVKASKAEALRECVDELRRLDSIGSTRRDLISDDDWAWFSRHTLSGRPGFSQFIDAIGLWLAEGAAALSEQPTPEGGEDRG